MRLPDGDLRLRDGRRIRRQSESVKSTEYTIEGANWREGRTGLHVIATIDRYDSTVQAFKELLGGEVKYVPHVSISRQNQGDVSVADMQDVWRLIFGEAPMTIRPAATKPNIWHIVSDPLSVDAIDTLTAAVAERKKTSMN